MSDRSNRRSANKLLRDIFDYLNSVNKPVNLNDIAFAIKSNTKVVQRWINIIVDSQLSNPLRFADYMGNKILIPPSSYPQYLLRVMFLGFEPDIRDILFSTWFDQSAEQNFSGNWILVDSIGDADLVVLHIGAIEQASVPTQSAILVYDPQIPMPELSDMFFYVLNHKYSNSMAKSLPTISPISLQLLSLAILGPVSETELVHIKDLIPYFITAEIQYTVENSEVYLFLNGLAKILNSTDLDITDYNDRSHLLLELSQSYFDELGSTDYGQVYIASIQFFTWIISPHMIFPNDATEWTLAHFWHVLNLMQQDQIGNDLFSLFIEYLDINQEDPHVRLLCHYFRYILSDYVEIIPLTKTDEIEYLDIIDADQNLLPNLFSILSSIQTPLNNLLEGFNWADFGRLLSIWQELDPFQFPYLRYYILNFMADVCVAPPTKYLLKHGLLSYDFHRRQETIVVRHVSWKVRYHLKQCHYTLAYAVGEELLKDPISTKIHDIISLDLTLLRIFLGDFTQIQPYFTDKDPSQYHYYRKNIINMLNQILQGNDLEILKIPEGSLYQDLSGFDTLDRVIAQFNYLKHMFVTRTHQPVDLISYLLLTPFSEFEGKFVIKSFHYEISSQHNFDSDDNVKIIHMARKVLVYDQEAKYRETIDLLLGVYKNNDNHIMQMLCLNHAYLIYKKLGSRLKIGSTISAYRSRLVDLYSRVSISEKFSYCKLYLALPVDGTILERDYPSLLRSIFPSIQLPRKGIHLTDLLKFLLLRDQICSD